MGRQYEFNFSSATVDPKKSIKAGYDLETNNWQATQDVTHFIESVKRDRDREAYFGKSKMGYRKMATIPDIVAIKIKEDYGIDLHDPAFMHDKDKLKKLKVILKMEYPHLLVNTQEGIMTYTELVALVRNWSNRDEEVVSDNIIKDSLRYAADKAYRNLRVPPLENVATYNKTTLEAATTNNTQLQSSKTEIKVPFDLIEIIQIKELDSAGGATRVFNEKLDVRTFNDPTAEKYLANNYFTRERNLIFLTPGFGENAFGNTADSIELLYYRRLPALDAKYAVTVLNFTAGFLTTSGGTTPLYFVNGNTTTAYATQSEATAADTGGAGTNSVNYIGTEVPNWLRDQNERILLYGALVEVFAFVQDDQQAAKYKLMFDNEINELNNEDRKRNASGGNVQINFNGRGLI